jgi:hypothetical protein
MLPFGRLSWIWRMTLRTGRSLWRPWLDWAKRFFTEEIANVPRQALNRFFNWILGSPALGRPLAVQIHRDSLASRGTKVQDEP